MDGFAGEVPKREDGSVKCPFCGKGDISVTHVSAYVSWNVSRIASGSKRTKYFHEPQINVHSSCPECKATKSDIRHILERGGSAKPHEERIKRLKEAMIPMVIEESTDSNID